QQIIGFIGNEMHVFFNEFLIKTLWQTWRASDYKLILREMRPYRKHELKHFSHFLLTRTRQKCNDFPLVQSFFGTELRLIQVRKIRQRIQQWVTYKMCLNAMTFIKVFFKWQDDKHLVYKLLYFGYAAFFPCPELWGNVIDDFQSGGFGKFCNPKIEPGIIYKDQFVRFIL